MKVTYDPETDVLRILGPEPCLTPFFRGAEMRVCVTGEPAEASTTP